MQGLASVFCFRLTTLVLVYFDLCNYLQHIVRLGLMLTLACTNVHR